MYPLKFTPLKMSMEPKNQSIEKVIIFQPPFWGSMLIFQCNIDTDPQNDGLWEMYLRMQIWLFVGIYDHIC